MCNKIDTLEGSYEITCPTALLLSRKGCFPDTKRVWSKIFYGIPPLDHFFFISDGDSMMAIAGGLWQGPHPLFIPSSLPNPVLPPGDTTLATQLVSIVSLLRTSTSVDMGLKHWRLSKPRQGLTTTINAMYLLF